MSWVRNFSLLALLLVACASEPARAPENGQQARARMNPPVLPHKCSRDDKDECLPPTAWVGKLCSDVYPEVALHMFRDGTPWQRLYMLSGAEGINAAGGVSLLGDTMEFGEEVIALHRYDNEGLVQVGDTAGYDVLRWNGACVTLHDGEFTRDPPPHRRHSRVEWRGLGDHMRQALKSDQEIASNYRARRQHCKGAYSGTVTTECLVYDQKLVDSIVSYVRSGPELPLPESYP